MNPEWFYSAGDVRKGPITEAELKKLIESGEVKTTDLVWKDGMEQWAEVRTVEVLSPRPIMEDRPRFTDDDDDRPRARRRNDDDDDRPSRRSRALDDDDDRPRARRDYDQRDDYDEERRAPRGKKPSQVQAVGVMLMIGGILGIIAMASATLSTVFVCCLWPGVYFELIWAIFAIIRGVDMMGKAQQAPANTIVICQIICIVNVDIVNCVLGIVSLVMLNDPAVQSYYRRKGY